MKKFVMFTILAALIFTTVSLSPVAAAKKVEVIAVPEQVVIFEGTVVVDSSMNKFEIGFATVTFKKNFIDENLYPLTFEVKIYAEDGLVYIEFEPSMDYFLKDVMVHAFAYDGYIFDVATGENIYVEIPNQTFKVSHFSRYCFAW